MNGAIGTTSGAIYVWGVDRGAGTVGFPTMAPGVIFDRVVILNNNDTSTLAGVTVTDSGNSITAVVPLSLAAMASTGFTPINNSSQPRCLVALGSTADFAKLVRFLHSKPQLLLYLCNGLAVLSGAIPSASRFDRDPIYDAKDSYDGHSTVHSMPYLSLNMAK